jgi:uncharacterized protein YndB with AHSA1/START domain
LSSVVQEQKMAELQFEMVIQRPVDAVFALIADLPNYDQWLPPSTLYGTVTQYSELPVHAGTHYVDQGRMSRMTGVVTEFEPPTRIAFRQTSVMLFGALTVDVYYTLAAEGDATRVGRQVVVRSHGAYSLLEPVLLGQIRKESERILAAMKAHLEKSSKRE